MKKATTQQNTKHKASSNKVPQEKKKNRISVVGSGDYSYSVYNPHNARFFFFFDSSSLNRWGVGSVFRVINSSELCLDSWEGCRWVIHKTMVEVTNKVDKERRFLIRGSVSDRHVQVIAAIAELERECLVRLRKFVSVFGGSSSFLPARAPVVWDNKILHDRIVDAIPQSVTFRNDVVKKVYNSLPSCVEVSSPEGASNMFRNLALLDVVPELESELGVIRGSQLKTEVLLDGFVKDVLEPLTVQIRLHLSVQEKTLKVLGLIERKIDFERSSRVRRLKEEWGL